MSAYGEMAMQAGLNSVMGVINNAMARQREAEARAENYRYGEMAATKADQRARKLYKDLQSPEALLKQYKDAGLSPSLMFGNGGSQGATPAQGAQGSGSSGFAPHTFGIDPMNMAQIDLMKAEARKANSEADTNEAVREPTVQNLFADLNKKFEETNNLAAKTELTKFEAKYKEIETSWANANYEINLKVANAQLELLANQSTLVLWQGMHEMTEAQVADFTKEARVKHEELKNDNLVKDLLVKNSTIKFNENQIEVLIKDVETKAMLAHAQYIEHMAGAAAKYNQADYLKRSEEFFDDQMGMWLSDFEKDFYKFGEEMGLKRDQLELEYKKLAESVRHNKRMEWNMQIMALNPFGKVIL